MKIEIEDLSFGYDKDRLILENQSMKIESGEVVAIVGPSGCGKSTLLRVICGLLPSRRSHHFTGQVRINDDDIKVKENLWREARMAGQLGFMFQDPCLLPNRSVEENIYLPLQILKRGDKGRDKVDHCLDTTGLIEDREKLPHQLSGGMRTRVALARTFITGPKLLLLDEPFSSLDMVWRIKLYEELEKQIESHRTTVVLVTHDLFEALYFSRKVMVLGQNGQTSKIHTAENWTSGRNYDQIVAEHNEDFLKLWNLIGHTQKVSRN